MKNLTSKFVSLLFVAFSISLLSLSSISCSSTTAVTPAANTINMKNSVFDPVTLTVTKGTTITWINQDSYAHTTTADGNAWDSGNIAAGASKAFTFDTIGTFPYHCTYHAAMGMKGTIIVK